jgi:RND family efflux transporter MFP subunit
VVLWAFAAASLPVLLGACSPAVAPAEPIRSVKIIAVGLDSFQAGYEFAAEVKARVETQLGFRVAGKIIRRQAEMGQRVKIGQVLAQLDPLDYKLATDAARAAVAAAQTNYELAQADYKRYSGLKDQNFISGADLERRESTLKAARAQLEQAQAQLAAQGNQAGYANLLADASGVVTAVLAEQGQVVAAGTPVFRIAQDGPRDVVFSVPEDKVAAVRTGSSVEVRVWAEKRSLTGKVREVAASADPVTRTFPVKVELPLEDPPALGATVYVAAIPLSGEATPVIKLPTSALKQDGRNSAVWVLDKASMTVHSQAIVIATADGNEAVIAAGLKPGDLVVSAGVHVLSPGQKVTIYREKVAEVTADKYQAVTIPAPAGSAGAASR